MRYRVLHGWQSWPTALRSDLDIVVDLNDLETLERALQYHSAGRFVQLLQYEALGFHFILAVKEGERLRFISLDATDYRRDDRVFFTADELLTGGYCWSGSWIAALHGK